MTRARSPLMAAVLPFLLAAGPALAPVPGIAASVEIAQAEPQYYTYEQLDQMLAPIALYPDTLLTQILIAAGFPQEVTEAQQWLQNPYNASLRGEQLVAALYPLPWDPSVKSLVPFPQVVAMLAGNPDWMQSLGYAFVNQQGDVMAEIQGLRQQARAAGKLQSSPQITVVDQGPAIVIQPANPALVYVPVYNPAVVYGGWPYPAYPPVYFPPPVGFAGVGIGVGIGFGIGIGVVAPLWGWATPAWGGGNVVINNVQINNFTDVRRYGYVNDRYGGGRFHREDVARGGFGPPRGKFQPQGVPGGGRGAGFGANFSKATGVGGAGGAGLGAGKGPAGTPGIGTGAGGKPPGGAPPTFGTGKGPAGTPGTGAGSPPGAGTGKPGFAPGGKPPPPTPGVGTGQGQGGTPGTGIGGKPGFGTGGKPSGGGTPSVGAGQGPGGTPGFGAGNGKPGPGPGGGKPAGAGSPPPKGGTPAGKKPEENQR